MRTVRYLWCATVLASLVLGLGMTSPAIAQQRIGVNSAVNPEATGIAPSAPPRRLLLGQDVVFNERITTGAEGQTQVLFVDQSAMTVGPNSDMVVDQFVYDPAAGTGKLAANLTRGVFRFVGGRLSKQENAVTLQTPTATIGIRGGVALVKLAAGGNLDVIFVYGKSVTVTGLNGVSQTITRSGWQVTVPGRGAAPANPAPSPPGAVAALLSQLDGLAGHHGGATTIPTEIAVANSGISQAIQQSTMPPVTPIQPPSNNSIVRQAQLQVQNVANQPAALVTPTPSPQAVTNTTPPVVTTTPPPVVITTPPPVVTTTPPPVVTTTPPPVVTTTPPPVVTTTPPPVVTTTPPPVVTTTPPPVVTTTPPPVVTTTPPPVVTTTPPPVVTTTPPPVVTTTPPPVVTTTPPPVVTTTPPPVVTTTPPPVVTTTPPPVVTTTPPPVVTTTPPPVVTTTPPPVVTTTPPPVVTTTPPPVVTTTPPPVVTTTPPPVNVTFAGIFKSTNGHGTTRGFVDQSALGRIPFTQGTLLNGVFSTTLGGTRELRIPLVPGVASFRSSGTASPLGPVSGTSFLSPDGTFFYANLTPANAPLQREFIAGGMPVSASSLATAPIVAFTVQPDAARQSNIPFIRNNAGGNLANAYISPLFIAPQTSAALQSSLAINGRRANQQSVLVTAIGNSATLQSSGAPMISGVVRGSSRLSAFAPSVRIGSSLSSVVDGNGNSLYGANAISGFVLDQTRYNSTGGALTTPLIGSAASEVPLRREATHYGFNQPATPTDLPAGVGTNRTSQSSLTGYFGGLMNTTARKRPYAITGITALSTNAETDRVTAVLASDALKRQASGGVRNIAMVFGPENSAFIDNNIYGAAESQLTPAAVNGKPAQAAQLYFLSSGAAPPPTSLLPAGASYCQCQYLQWGYWGGDITSASASGGITPRIDRGNINFWAAGAMTPLADMNLLASQGATGTYNGHLIGSVFNNGTQYVAAGGLTATYQFATQSGTFSVNNYDGRSFMLSGKAPLTGSSYNFGINNPQGLPITGSVNGSFYGPMAAETGGNFNFRTTAPGSTYLTSGIFAAKR